MTRRLRLLIFIDRISAALLATLLVGTTLAFGGAVWWARPAIAALTFAMVLAWLGRAALTRSWRVLKSPLVPLGALSLALAMAQLVPMPGGMATLVSPGARAVHVVGAVPDRVEVASAIAAAPLGSRATLTVDRSATLRWLAGATACLALFWGVGQFVDRQTHLLVVWGSVVAAFGVNTVLASVQVLGGSEGLYGAIEPGTGGALTPSLDDLAAMPNATVLRPSTGPGPAWAVARPERPFLVGSLMGGPGAYLALGALALPLTLALMLQTMAPRGSREDLATRLRLSGQGGLVALLGTLVGLGSLLVGFLAGPALAAPFAIGLGVVGLPAARRTGLRWWAVGTTGSALIALGFGVLLGLAPDGAGAGSGHAAAERLGWASTTRVWADSAAILRDFPALGSGLGSFAAIYPHYKSGDPARTTALSSLLQWAIEAGAAGLLLLALAAIWCARRLPPALRAVGTADRALAFGLVGAVACFGLFSAVHWTVELSAVALSASAVGGAWDRWLAGGTDLFV